MFGSPYVLRLIAFVSGIVGYQSFEAGAWREMMLATAIAMLAIHLDHWRAP